MITDWGLGISSPHLSPSGAKKSGSLSESHVDCFCTGCFTLIISSLQLVDVALFTKEKLRLSRLSS